MKKLMRSVIASAVALTCLPLHASRPALETFHSGFVSASNGSPVYYSSGASACAAVIKSWRGTVPGRTFSLSNAVAVSNYSRLGAGYAKNQGWVTCNYTYVDSGQQGSKSDQIDAVTWDASCPAEWGDYRVEQGSDDVIKCGCDSTRVEKYNRCVPAEEAEQVKADYKNTSGSSGVCAVGNPVNPATGAKFLAQVDYAGSAGVLPLRFERHYNSRTDSATASVGMGWGWRHSFSKSLVFDKANALPSISVLRPDGAAVVFDQQQDGTYAYDADVSDRLVAIRSGNVITGYQFTQAKGAQGVGVVETFDAQGRILSLKTLGGWTQTFFWSASSTSKDIAPGAGYLIAVKDSSGRQLQLRYNDAGQIKTLLDPKGQSYSYFYDDQENLTKVTNPRGESRTYVYNEGDHIEVSQGVYGDTGSEGAFPHALTGIQDEVDARYADYRYDESGRGIETEHAGGADKHVLAYNEDHTLVTDPLGQARRYDFAVRQGVAQNQEQDLPCSTGSPYRTVKSDVNGNPEYEIDFNGNRTNHVYDMARNLETSRTEGLTAEGAFQAESRTITTQWHTTWDLPVKVARPLLLTTYAYYPNGTLKSVREDATTDKDGSKGLSPALDTSVAARVVTYTYNTEGQVMSVDGPRTDVSDVTTFDYHPSSDSMTPPRWNKGDLKSIKNALGHVTTFSQFDEHGNVLTSADANAIITQYGYDELGRIETRTVGGLQTTFTHDPRGMLHSRSEPSGLVLTYGYDDAHRLTSITDNDGNRIEYELDAMGNPKAERTYNASNDLVRMHAREYNLLNRLEWDIGGTDASKQRTYFEYDLAGNLKQIIDPLKRVTDQKFDALNRLKELKQPLQDGPGSARPVTLYAYDGLDQLVKVTDPRSLVTSYKVDGLGNRREVNSPDTGVQVITPDAAGNVRSAQDAKAQLTQHSYDALGRVLESTFQDGARHVYQYDIGDNAKGKLTQIREYGAGGAVSLTLDLAYDDMGRVEQVSRTLAGRTFTSRYQYDSAGRLETVSYPSGRTVVYGHDDVGRVKQISTRGVNDGSTKVVVANVKYDPDGRVAQFTYGNGQLHQRSHDMDGHVSGYTLGLAAYAVDIDEASQIKAIRRTGSSPATTSYGWDGLGRVKSAVTPATSFGYSYDPVGNRTKFTAGSSVTNLGYETGKNWLTTVGLGSQQFDANGSLKQNATGTFLHDSKGRLQKFEATGGAATTYQVDAQGMRIRKTNAQGDVVYVHDIQGRLISEQSPGGTTLKEYIYLGQWPVGVIAP
jgi:YD repeat-containing protein